MAFRSQANGHERASAAMDAPRVFILEDAHPSEPVENRRARSGHPIPANKGGEWRPSHAQGAAMHRTPRMDSLAVEDARRDASFRLPRVTSS